MKRVTVIISIFLTVVLLGGICFYAYSKSGVGGAGSAPNTQHYCSADMAQHVARVDSTCQTQGTREHWKCSVCGKLYADNLLRDEIQTVTLELGEHTPDSTGTCTVCGHKSSGYCGLCDDNYEEPGKQITSSWKWQRNGITFDSAWVYYLETTEETMYSYFTDSIDKLYNCPIYCYDDDGVKRYLLTLTESSTIETELKGVYSNGSNVKHNGCADGQYAVGGFEASEGYYTVSNLKTPHAYDSNGVCIVCGGSRS